MKSLSVSDFREQCLQLLEGQPAEGILITKRGRVVAKVTPIPSSCSHLIGSMHGLVSNPAVYLRLAMLHLPPDPADEAIAATSLTHDLAFVTRDRRIRTSK